MYELEKKVYFSDVGPDSKLSINGMISAIQDCINYHIESLGKGVSYLKSINRVWFTVSWNIEIKKMPQLYDDLKVRTWPYGFTSLMGKRNVVIADSKDEVIICAESNWAYMDWEKQQPTRITEKDVEYFVIEDRYPMEEVSRKIKLPEEFTFVESIKVRKADLDVNKHMTNGKYIVHACEYVDYDNITNIRIEYKEQSRLDEIIDVYINENISTETNTNVYVIRFVNHETGTDKAIIEIKTRAGDNQRNNI